MGPSRRWTTEYQQRRTQEADYDLLHETARHGVHVSETLDVATRSLGALLQQHHDRHTRMCCSPQRSGLGQWDGVANRIQSQLRFLEGLLQRSSANNARIQNEITLVSASWLRKKL